MFCGIVGSTTGELVRVVLDTNVLVAAMRSRRGASFALLAQLERGAFDIVLSVPLVIEYEDALLRQIDSSALTAADIGDLLDALCAIGHHQEIFYLWRPLLPDPKDDMVAEVGVAASCDAIVTHNVRDFVGLEPFAVEILKPADFLRQLRGRR